MPIAVTLFAPMFHTASSVRHVLLCYPYLVARVNGKKDATEEAPMFVDSIYV